MNKLLKESLSQELLRSKAKVSEDNSKQVRNDIGHIHFQSMDNFGYHYTTTSREHDGLVHKFSHPSGDRVEFTTIGPRHVSSNGKVTPFYFKHENDLYNHLRSVHKESVTEMDDSEAGPVSGDGTCLQCNQTQCLLDENGLCSICSGKKESFDLKISYNQGTSLLEANEEANIGNLMKTFTLSKDLHPHAVYIDIKNEKAEVKFEFLNKQLENFFYPLVLEFDDSHQLSTVTELYLAMRWLKIDHDADQILESLRSDNTCLVINDKPIPQVSVVDKVMAETANLKTALIGHTVELHYTDRNYNSIKKTFKTKQHAQDFIKKDDKDKYGNIRSVHGIRNLASHEMHPKTAKEVSMGPAR